MDYRYKQLEQELSALSKAFSELGVRLSEVAKEVSSPGVMPSEKLLDQISASRTSFDNVRTAVHGHAGAMLVSPLPKLGELVSVVAIDSLLKVSAVAEENKFSIEAEREKALAILARVLSISHRETNDFKPLQECHARLGELRSAISNVLWPHRHPDSETIVASKHPSNALLSFVENLDSLDDEKWMSLENTITETYGKPLFVAASRGKLAVRAEVKADAPAAAAKPPAPAPAPPKAPVVAAPEPPKPSVAAEKPTEKPVEKPAEKKAAAEKTPEKPAPAPVPAAAPAASVEKKIAVPPAPAAAPVAAPVPAVAVEKKEAGPEKVSPRPSAPPAPVVSAPPAPAAAAASPEKKESVEKPHPAPAVVPAAPAPAPHVSAPAAIVSPAPLPLPPPGAVAVTPAPTAATHPVAATPAAPPRTAASAPAPATTANSLPATPAPAAVAAVPPPPPVVVNNSHAPAVPQVQNVNVNSLTALATATEPPAEKKSTAPTPIDTVDKQRKEPRLAAPPQQVAKSEPNAEELAEQTQNAGGDAGQRPQRWGFWRGNR